MSNVMYVTKWMNI